MKIKDFDERCLDGLSIDELQSVLKSNVISWDVRKRIRAKLKTLIAVKIITDSLPLITTVAVVSTSVGFVKKILEDIYDENARQKPLP